MQKLIAGFAVFLAVAIPSLFGVRAIQNPKALDELFSPEKTERAWKTTHCDLRPAGPGTFNATFWKGYETTGFETTSLPLTDWSAWKSLKFDVANPYDEPFSVYVRISGQPDHPSDLTYTGGTFDGFIIAPGKNTVEISLEAMQSPEERDVDPKRVAYLGIFFASLFLRDGMDLKFLEDKTLQLSNFRLDTTAARLQKQPYAELLFTETAPELAELRREVEGSITELRGLIQETQRRGIDTAYEEIPPFLAEIAFNKRLVAFWQDRVEQQRDTLEFSLRESRRASSQLREVLEGKRKPLVAPPLPAYSELSPRDGYFRLGEEPKLIFGMLYNRQGPLLRWFANSQTDYGTQLVAGATRHNVERQPIWEIYQRYPETHRVGWDRADHIIRDRGSWEVVGPPVNICLENPRTRQAVAQAIENYLRSREGRGDHLVMNLGFEYFYVCYCDITRQMWREWLARRHGDIATANQVWGTSYGSFDEVPMLRIETAATNRALWFDWSSFNLDRFLKQIRWTHEQIRRWEPSAPLTVGSPYYAFSPRFWTAMDEEELADSGMTGVVLEENYALDTLMPEYLHALAGGKPVADFEYHGVVQWILPGFLHGDAAISMWWWNDEKHWTPNEPINEWASSFPQSYTIPLRDVAKAMRDALDLRRLSREMAALGSAPRPVALLYSKTSMLQHLPEESSEADAFPYLVSLRQTYNASQSSGIYVGLITEKKILAGDLKARKVLVVPGAEFVPQPVVDKVLDWVRGGGTMIVVPDSLLGDEYARPSRVMQSLGLRIVRSEPPALKRGEKLVTEYNLADLPRMPLKPQRRGLFAGQSLELESAGTRQVIECDPRLVVASFADGSPALLRIERGKGRIYWLAAPLTPGSWGRFLSAAAAAAGVESGLRVTMSDSDKETEAGLEYRVAEYSGGRLAYFFNSSSRPLRFRLEPRFHVSQIIDRRTETVLAEPEFDLPAGETAILEFR
jgi:Beta-galactosidase